jgi:hypothetical protein
MFTGVFNEIGRTRPAALDGHGLEIVGWRPITGEA